MPRHIAFLRAINVGGHVVKMPVLKSLFEGMGYTAVETFIASGNVIFSSRSGASSGMVSKIERALREALGYEVATFIRTDAEVAAIAAQSLFTPQEVAASHSVSVGLLGAPLSPAALEALAAFNTATEQFRPCGREVHFLTRVSMANSKFSNAKFEKALGVPATFRNVNTMARLAETYPPAVSERLAFVQPE